MLSAATNNRILSSFMRSSTQAWKDVELVLGEHAWTSVSLPVRNVKAALRWQILHTAASFVMLSETGIRAWIVSKGRRWNVLSNPATITVLPAFAHFSAYFARSANPN